MHQIALPALEAVVTLSSCEAPPPDPVVTTVAPVREHQSLYLAVGGCLYAVNAADGRARWCQQVKLTRTREVRYPPEVSVPPPPRMHFATPRVVDGVSGVDGQVYVSIDGWVSYTCAFAADDGSLRWWTPTDARVYGGHFMDWAVPLVHNGIVYSGTYALSEQDGAVRWRVAIDTLMEGALALHALTNDTLFATTDRGIYAINAQDGQIRWRYQPEEPRYLSGPPVVSGRLLYAGTSGGVGYPERGHFFALDVETGTEVWRYPHLLGGYIGAVVHHETIYVSSGDRSLYALDAKSGVLRWRQPFAAPGQYLYNLATVANDVLYLTADGAYALRSADGGVLWHQPLGSSPSVSFCPLVVLDGAVYLVRLDKRGGVLYALDTRTGAKCWYTPYPSRGAHIAVAQ
jgi:outer membrane protein assembly factor BamB